jgi:hypothetical protein
VFAAGVPEPRLQLVPASDDARRLWAAWVVTAAEGDRPEAPAGALQADLRGVSFGSLTLVTGLVPFHSAHKTPRSFGAESAMPSLTPGEPSG